MTISEAFGITSTVVSSEIDLFDVVSAVRNYSTKIFLDGMLSNTIMILRVYDFDTQSSSEELYDTQTFSGTQDPPEIFVPYIPTSNYRVTVEQVATGDSVFDVTWSRYEV